MKKRYYNLTNQLKQACLILTCLCFQITLATAQTPAENLQNGVEIYNALREYGDGLTPATITAANLDDAKSRMNKGLALLEKVIREGNAEEIRTARYFKNNFKYEYMFALGMKGLNAEAFDICKEIEREMTGFTAADFPFRYVYFDKNYTIKWENFAATQAEYLTGFAEIAYNLSKYEDAVRINRLALAHPNSTPWLKYIALNKMLDIHSKNNTLLTEDAQLDYALQSISAYQVLTESEQKTAVEFKYPSTTRGVGIILDKALQNNPAAIARCGQAAIASSQAPVNEKTLDLFDICYKNKQSGDANFHAAAEAYARKTTALYPAKSTAVGVSAVDRMAVATSTTDCGALSNIIDKYTYWKQTTKAGEYTKKRQQCLDNEAKAQKRAAKITRRNSRNFNLYTGVYVFPLFKSNAKRDYGGVVNFAFKKTAWEFSYMKINKNKENIFDLTVNDVDADQDDLPRWNGFYAHVHPKFSMDKHTYLGPLLGYAQKDFESLTATATRDADGALSSETFTPKVTQYIAMLNLGALGLVRGAGFDMYFGIGATYNSWETGNAINTADYTIDNPILENRKDNYFGIIMRTGFTVGLNFGRGNMN